MTNEISKPSTKYRTAAAALVVSAATLVGIAANEGYVGTAYKDVVGVPTIGFGETKGVRAGQTTTPVRALIQLEKSMNEYAAGVAKCTTAPISQNEFDAYVSFSYNLGVGAYCNGPAKLVNQGKYEEACKRILLYDHAGGKVYPGLTKRRQEEYKTCMGE